MRGERLWQEFVPNMAAFLDAPDEMICQDCGHTWRNLDDCCTTDGGLCVTCPACGSFSPGSRWTPE